MGKYLYSPKSVNVYSLRPVYYCICQSSGISGKTLYLYSISELYFTFTVFFTLVSTLFGKQKPQTQPQKINNPVSDCTEVAWIWLEISQPASSLLFPPYGLGILVRAQADTELRRLLKVLNSLQETLKVKWHGRRRMKYTSKVMMKSWSDSPYFSDQLIRWYVFKHERYIETHHV